ncbi:MAG: HlyD family efflux transporter periplasmic adaptor subunit [Candidatus Brocadiia bacterium]
MPIKFRRIEDRKTSVMQLRQRKEETKRRTRLLPKIVTLLLLAGLALGAYLLLRPPRIVAPAFVRVETLEVVSPTAGTVEWMLPLEQEQVERGQTIARIVPQREAGTDARARLADLRVRLAAVSADLKQERGARRALEASLAARGENLQAEAARAEALVAEAEVTLRNARQTHQSLQEELESARKLYHTDALTADALRRAEERARSAAGEVQNAQKKLESIRVGLDAARAAVRGFAQEREAEMSKADARLAALAEQRQELQAAVADQENAIGGQGDPIEIPAPADGVVLALHASEGSQIGAGASLLSYYKPERKLARAAVPVQHRGELRPGQPARLYLSGAEDPIHGEIMRIYERVEQLPGELRAQRPSRPRTIPVDIRLNGEDAAALIPGDVGEVVIGK